MKPMYKFFDAQDFKQLISQAFINKTRKGRIQFFRYFFVGGFSAVVNLTVLAIFTSGLRFEYLVSELIAFIIATITNYILSVWWIFQRSNKFKTEFLLFTLIGVVGLGINELVLWLCVTELKLFYLFSEAVAILVVMVWSFVLRKILFDRLTH